MNTLLNKETPELPPGILDIVDHNKVIICKIANNTVNGVFCRCSAKYKVAMSVVI